MNKSKWNFIVDVFLFLLLMAMGGIGFLMAYILLPGSKTWEKYGTKIDLTFLSLDRHQWGDIHLIISFIFLALIVLHTILHWKLILELYRKLIKNRIFRTVLGIFFVIICLLLLLFFLVINPVVTEGERHQRFIDSKKIPLNETITFDKKTESIQPLKRENKSQNQNDSNLNIRGFMTLQEVASEHNIPIDYLKRELQLPMDTSKNENLGRLKRRYNNFKMSDVERIILEYKKTKDR